jgi:predicted transcriptional regulator
MTEYKVSIGDDYTAELKRRLEKYDIGYGELAREMGTTTSQISRWMNSDIQPQLRNVTRIERAIVAIRARKAQRKRGE